MYKQEFIAFLVRSNALLFGDFTLKSGRKCPYFINTGMFSNGEKIGKLGEYYAAAIKEKVGEDFDLVYGPAYKGIPLCVTTTIGLQKIGMNKGYVFNRKEAKDHGEGGGLIGAKVTAGSRVIIVDDVITSGASIRESLDALKLNQDPKVSAIIIAVDREEKGKTEKNALKELEEEFGIRIFPIVTLSEIKQFLHNKKIDGKVMIDDEMIKAIDHYKSMYGAK